MPIEFFAMPEEQIMWLHEQIEGSEMWCWARSSNRNEFMLSANELRDGSSEIIDAIIDFYLGISSISAPIIRRLPGRNELDPVRSQCVQFDPSRLVNGNALLMGHLGISPHWSYRENGIDDRDVCQLYKKLQRELKTMMSRDYQITQMTTNRQIKKWQNIHVSIGAQEFWRQGNLLKQFASGPVVFGIEQRPSKGR